MLLGALVWSWESRDTAKNIEEYVIFMFLKSQNMSGAPTPVGVFCSLVETPKYQKCKKSKLADFLDVVISP